MITINDLDFHLGNTVLFQSASAQISTGSKVGLVGRNGCGKSTFFSLLTGDYIPDGGSISIPGDWQIATVKQETPALEISALDYVIEGFYPGGSGTTCKGIFGRLENETQPCPGADREIRSAVAR